MAHSNRNLRLLLLCACLFLFISLALGHGGVDDDHEETSDGKTPDLHRSNLLRSKGGSIVVFFLVPFIGCWLPWIFRFNELFFKLGLLFSAGLFVSLSIEHLLADSFSSFGSLTSSSYPFAGMIAVSGYMLAWLADITAHSIWHRAEESKSGSVPIKDVESTGPFEHHEHASTVNKFSIAQSDLSLIDLLLLLFALCFHAFFEGLAVGLAGSVYDVWQTSISIVLHKFFEGLALGASIKLQDDNISIFLFALYAVAFSITAPVGIAVGIILNRTVSYRGLEWTEAIGNSFAAGVFIFVSLTHLLSRGFKPNKGDGRSVPFLKWGFAFLGAVVYSLIQMKES